MARLHIIALCFTMFLTSNLFCMHSVAPIQSCSQDTLHRVFSFCDISDVASFSVTNREYSGINGNDNNQIDSYLYNVPELSVSFSEDQHINAFMHYLDKGDDQEKADKMINHLTLHESDENRDKRLRLFHILGYEKNDAEYNYTQHKAAFQGITVQNTVISNKVIGLLFAQALFHGTKNNKYAFKVFIKNKIAINSEITAPYHPQSSFLFYAIQSHHLDLLKLLLKNGVDLTMTVSEKTPLLKAVESDNIPAVRLLLENGIDPNDDRGACFTPLYWAKYRPEIKQLLLNYGARTELEQLVHECVIS